VEWGGTFKDEDSTPLLACSERDVDAAEYRRVLEQCIANRNLIRPVGV
jgi:hypothetical protein